jgi:alpha-galactosidase
MNRLSILLVFIVLFLLTLPATQAQSAWPVKKLAGYDMEITGNAGNFDISTAASLISKDLYEITILLKSTTGKEESPGEFSLEWSLPAVNILGSWSPSEQRDRRIQPVWGNGKTLTSTLAGLAPVISLFGNNDQNRLTFACSDALNKIALTSGIKEEDSRIYCSAVFFREKHRPVEQYQVKLLIDTRPLPYYSALQNVSNWWAAMENYQPAVVPANARLPMYSTWYSYHKDISEEKLLDECKAASRAGYKAIIIDDGWQAKDNVRGYGSTGDWQPEKLTRLAELTANIHQLAMKVMLWYSLPFVGIDAKAYPRFKGKFLKMADKNRAGVLDPRYPEVRQYLIGTYVAALKKYNLDGFKLDFIDNFQSNETTVLSAADGRDYASVNEATDRLMSDIMSSLKKLNPAVLIEFRQSYIGPLMRKYGNMFRSGDCPNSAITNRIQTTDIKLLCGNTAVHADMMEWNYQEPTEIAALQLLNTIFAVPQISVRLNEIPQDHLKMIRFYNNYWLQNQRTLLDGKFAAYAPLANYPVLASTLGTKAIYALYNNIFIQPDMKVIKELDVINAKEDQLVVICSAVSKNGRYKIINCKGELLKGGKIRLKKGLNAFTVPASGLMKFMATNQN